MCVFLKLYFAFKFAAGSVKHFAAFYVYGKLWLFGSYLKLF